MFRKATKKDCRSVYDLICDMENTALDYDEFSAIFSAQCDDENYYCLILDEPGDSLELDEPGVGLDFQANDKAGEAEGAESISGNYSGSAQNMHIRGMLNLRFEYQLHHAACIAEIMELVVAAQCRNKGIGKLMLNEACRIAKENGCIQIEVACNQLRKDTHRFYAREGMKNYHYKFSKPLVGDPDALGEGNRLGR